MNKPTITFRAKPVKIWWGDHPRLKIKIPELTAHHCDMAAFRESSRFGPYANSDLFPSILKRELTKMGIPPTFYEDEKLPDCMTIDKSGFLWMVTIILN